MEDLLLKTPLHEAHLAAGGKMVPFAGFEMPVQYPTGILAEHRAVREAAGLFDVSHMGEFDVRGPQALDLIQRVTVNDASKLEVGQAQYSALCREHGGVIDDLLVYRFVDHYMLVVNASNREKDFGWIVGHAGEFEVDFTDRSDQTALLAIQGPKAAEILSRLTEEELGAIGYYRATIGQAAGAEGVISRTGYTGEDGFELYLGTDAALEIWNRLLEVGAGYGLIPAGLGARDSLRLEMGYALYGNDLDEEHTALESGLGWIVKLDKESDFIGREALGRQKEEGITRRLVGMRLTDRGFPRPGYAIVAEDRDVGVVTSGVSSPSVGCGVALGYIEIAHAAEDSAVGIRVRDKVIPALVQRPPFYTEGSIRR